MIFIASLYDENIESYSVIKEYVTKLCISIFESGCLNSCPGPKYRNYKNLICNVPEKIRKHSATNSSQDLDDIAKIVLGEDEDDYIRSIDVYNKTIAFQNLSNMYRIYTDGLLEYKYLHGVNSYEKGSKVEALKECWNLSITGEAGVRCGCLFVGNCGAERLLQLYF